MTDNTPATNDNIEQINAIIQSLEEQRNQAMSSAAQASASVKVLSAQLKRLAEENESLKAELNAASEDKTLPQEAP